jgi:hypothetical protein
MAIQLKINTTATTPTQNRLYEMMTENTGKHFLDSGMSDGRHWQQNQKLTISDFLERPGATLETEYGTYPTLDLFHFLNDRVELTKKAQELQSDWESFVADDNALSFYDLETMETWAGFAHEGTEKDVKMYNSYNWENYLSQTIQYLTFQQDMSWFVLLQIHNGADVRGGYTLPQVFEIDDEYTFFSMCSATIQCTGENRNSPEGSEPCEFSVDIRGCTDIYGADGSLAMTSSEFYELKVCPECGGKLEAIAPESMSW